MTRIVALLVIAGCGEGSRLEPPERAPAGSPDDIEVRDVEVSGAQKPHIVGLYLNRAVARAVRFCRPEPGSTATVAMTIDRRGRIAELGLRSDSETAVDCLRPRLEVQGFPRAKGRTLVTAHMTFRAPE